jgi:peroxiredoxin
MISRRVILGEGMDNINVIRVGFFTPEIKLTDSNGEIDDPIDRSGTCYTALIFINADEKGTELIKALESGLPRTASGMDIKLSAVIPAKAKLARAFKEKAGFNTRLFGDSDLRLGKAFSVVDSSRAKPSYHSVIFVIGDEGSVRYRQIFEGQNYDIKHFQSSVGRLI